MVVDVFPTDTADYADVVLPAAGTIWPDEAPTTAFAEGRFATPNGKLQLAGSIFETVGLAAVPSADADAPPPTGHVQTVESGGPVDDELELQQRPTDRAVDGANVNALTDTARTDIGDSSAIHSLVVEIQPHE